MWKLLKYLMFSILSFIVILFIIFPITCTINNSFRRNKVESECSNTNKVPDPVILLNGFDNKEFDSILVKEYNGASLLDSFKVFVFPYRDIDSVSKERIISLSRPLNIHNRYLFMVPGQTPYELANMKMDVLEEETMTSTVYLCELNEYTIDGVKNYRGNPQFIKR